ncbi:HAD-IIB family hydrolase [Marinovum sp. 2_MG-2023]|uniref:HAD-IIB family hydrolase n=1 Tax=unclassified Marinovum TaxID=2647166 RepID=UPI0026E2EE4C|nr:MULTISPECIES: HAD-IIB family hydrolase [unclassified Marinovum]MDO6732650.1 HAD-IIB family hydrolase [Marinovum sp. 2_MG-2023]MDO6781852.1 HAD-IIB family hydrolase [Marinovum sp. 1_MG-2023]
MTNALPLLVFTDLDGTLLDHATYSYAPALPALEALKSIGAGVTLATSKTAAEVAPLRAELGLEAWPAIVENGAGLLDSGATAGSDDKIYRDIRDRLAQLPGKPSCFRGFGDMNDAEVAEITGLPLENAANARRRAFSEPGIWTGPPAELHAFLDTAATVGLHARRGGRFLTFSLGQTKAGQMANLITRFRPSATLALGDAPNDIEMLDTADAGVIIANAHGQPLPTLPGEESGRIRRSVLPGPSGWNVAVLAHLQQIP